jgi:UDP-2,3-diacylglucosamine pyrophosphatase LpxH
MIPIGANTPRTAQNVLASPNLNRPGWSPFPGDRIKIIVVSDVHLGSEDSDKTSFNAFLTSLREDETVTDLVLLGDIVDMWRRDASGVFLENMDTVEILVGLKERMKVHWLAGNHDYHLMKLRNQSYYHYPFEFLETLDLVDGEQTYHFMHGYEFEYGKELPYLRPVLELLCHVMSDAEGVPEDHLWVDITKLLGDLHYTAFVHHLEGKDTVVTHQSLHESPAVRLLDKLEKLETRAYDEVRNKPGHMLIFGHTHHPFINTNENLVNTGSWVTEALLHNTYVVIENGKPRLFIYNGEEITERIEVE